MKSGVDPSGFIEPRRQRTSVHRRLGFHLLAGIAVLVSLAACSSGGTADSSDSTGPSGGVEVRVVISDGEIRPEGAECSGARPYRHIRPGLAYTVQTPDGSVLASGTLPPGVAENADPTIDWEDLARIPTVCIMDFAVGALPEHPEYEMHIDGVRPMTFTADDVAVGAPIVLIVPG